jgi:formylglycine-generating enzyme required for sulfatase activity
MNNSWLQLSYLMGGFAVLCGTLACTADLKIPDGIVLACEDNSECPASAQCMMNDDGTARVCVTNSEPSCGNGVQEAGETCDDGNGVLTDACPDGENGTCRLAECGDGFVVNGGGEDCEPSLEQVTCNSIDNLFQVGNVSCSGECRFDFSTCFNDPDIMIEGMVYVPLGTFWMGCNKAVVPVCYEDVSPYHEVYLDGFYIDTTELTAGAYKTCVDAGSCAYGGSTTDGLRTYNNGRDDHPINYVNWSEAKTYCEWLGKRLPTEAEWEKAARGTDGRNYPWGNAPPTCDRAVMYGCPSVTQPVGSLNAGASPYGAMDMSGNVWEWTADWFGFGYYSETPAGGWVNPEGPDSASYRVLRGGSFVNDSNTLRASVRGHYDPGSRSHLHGFRCAQ